MWYLTIFSHKLNKNVFVSAPLTAGNKSYSWKVVPEYTAHGVCLERMHRAFGELLMLAQCYNPAGTGPRRVSALLPPVLSSSVIFFKTACRVAPRNGPCPAQQCRILFDLIRGSPRCPRNCLAWHRCAWCCFVDCNRFQRSPACCACFWRLSSFRAVSNGLYITCPR